MTDDNVYIAGYNLDILLVGKARLFLNTCRKQNTHTHTHTFTVYRYIIVIPRTNKHFWVPLKGKGEGCWSYGESFGSLNFHGAVVGSSRRLIYCLRNNLAFWVVVWAPSRPRGSRLSCPGDAFSFWLSVDRTNTHLPAPTSGSFLLGINDTTENSKLGF